MIAEKLFTVTISEAAEYIIDEYALPVTAEEAVEGMDAIIREFYQNEVELKEGARELLEYFKAREIPMVIGTSTDRDCIEVGLERTGLSSYFDRIYTSTEVGKSKAEPDLFLQAMDFMASAPEETIVFEDGLYSLKTAVALGMKTVGIFDDVSHANQKELKELADLYVGEGESLVCLIEGLEG